MSDAIRDEVVTAPTREEVERGLRAVLAKCSYISSRGIGGRSLPPHLIDGIAPTLADYVLGLIRDETTALRARVEALTGERDAATARAERAVGVVNAAREYVKHYKSVHSMSLGASMAHAERMGVLLENLREAISALLASGGAGGAT